jgi:hypothetical protein
MNVFKSLLFGLLSLIAGEILLLVTIATILTLGIQASAGRTAVGIDVVSFAKSSPLVWILAVLAFALGFHWEHRRLKLRQAG